jgi:hypothetical protein
MKSWIPIPDSSTDRRRVVLLKLGEFVARLLLVGSFFLIHPGERCANDIGRPTVRSADVPRAVAPHSVAEAPSAPDTVQPNF